MNEMKTQQPPKNRSGVDKFYTELDEHHRKFFEELENNLEVMKFKTAPSMHEAAGLPKQEPDVTLPEPPSGHRWEYRGVGWDNDKKPTLYAHCCRNYPDPHFGRYQLVPEGNSDTHYWEAVVDEPKTCDPVADMVRRVADEWRDEPRYRTLERGETIREGDEYQDLEGNWWKTMWAGKTVYHLRYRRLMDPNPPVIKVAGVEKLLTDQQKLQIAIDALEKARGWKVADEALRRILE